MRVYLLLTEAYLLFTDRSRGMEPSSAYSSQIHQLLNIHSERNEKRDANIWNLEHSKSTAFHIISSYSLLSYHYIRNRHLSCFLIKDFREFNSRIGNQSKKNSTLLSHSNCTSLCIELLRNIISA